MFNSIRNILKFKLPFLSMFDVCLDFGTSNTRIAVKEKGIVLREPTFLGLNNKTREYIFFGQEAKTIVGKTPDFVKIIRPVVSGVISDFDAQTILIKNFFEKSVDPYLTSYPFLKPRLRAIASVASVATEIEQKAVEEVLLKIGFSTVHLIEKPLATAAGCGFNILSHHPHLIVDMGGGLIESSIVSGGGIVAQKSLKNAGDHLNSRIANYAYLKHGIILGDATCESLKLSLLNFKGEEKTMMVRGKSLENGLPKSVKINSTDVKEALLANFNQIIDAVKELIEISPPEVVDFIFNRGIVLTGGLARIPGMDRFFSTELKFDAIVIDNPADVTIHGLIRLAKSEDDLSKLSYPKI